MSQKSCKTGNITKNTGKGLEKKECVDTGKPKTRIKLTEKQEKTICEMYLSGISSIKIGESKEMSKHTVIKCLRKHNIKFRDNCHNHRKYNLNESFFDKIDTIEKAQILGFLYADGCNDERNNSITVILSEKDLEYLEFIKKNLNSNFTIQHGKNYIEKYDKFYKHVKLYFGSKHISQTLSKQGCWQNKSLTLEFPTREQVPEYLIWHFLRGYFEGDGCIYKNKTNNKFEIHILGTLNFITSIKDILKQNNINSSIKPRSKNKTNCYELYFGGNRQVLKFCDLLYKDCNFIMNRKYSIYLNLIKVCKLYDNIKQNKIKASKNFRNKIINMYFKKKLSIKQISENVTFGYTWIRTILDQYKKANN